MKWPHRIETTWKQLGLAPDVEPADLVVSGLTWEDIRCCRGVGRKTAWQIRERLLECGYDLSARSAYWLPKPPVIHWRRDRKTACGVAVHDRLHCVDVQSEATCKGCLRPPKSPPRVVRVQGRITIKVRGIQAQKVVLKGTFQEILQQLYKARRQALEAAKDN